MCSEAAAVLDDFVPVYGPESEPKEIQAAPLKERFLTDCDFDRGACEWVQDNEDDLDWTIKYHENGREYYLALGGPVGNRKEQGQNMGVLRVMLDNSAIAVWEKRNPHKQSWQSETITINWTENTPEAIVFEAERGKFVSGEIGLDHVALISGPCLDDKTIIF